MLWLEWAPDDGLTAAHQPATASHDRIEVQIVAEDEQILSTLEEIGQEAVIWGAGSKGITFLNLVNGSDRIQYAVDVNPHKQGKYITGTGQQIVAPEALCAIKPDVIFVMNHVYLEEIRQTIHALDIEPRLVTV